MDLMAENLEPNSSITGLKANPEKVEFGVVGSNTELSQYGSCEGIKVKDTIGDESGQLEISGGLKPDTDGVSLELAGIGVVEKWIEVGKDEVFKEIKVEDHPAGNGFEKVVSLGGLIEEEIEKVSLSGASNCSFSDGFASCGKIAGGNGFGIKSSEITSVDCEGYIVNDVKSGEVVRVDRVAAKSDDVVLNIDGKGVKSGEMGSDDDESNSESESKSGSSSSSASSSSECGDGKDDDDEEEEEEEEEEEGEREEEGMEEIEGEMDLEEGEKSDSDVGKMVAWSDDEEDGVAGSSAIQGRIKSKNELEDFPPVPPVNVTLQQYHQTLPVGIVLSIIGAKVIIEGMEKHNPLNEGSILWITESRSPLGQVDEIFGPVKNPYYVVRYNSESEVPAGIRQGTLISFVPEFSHHVLNDSNLYKKGYDASGDNDEEDLDEVEFSDDEKEAEYRRMLKMTKRGTNDQKSENKKKDKKFFKNHGGNWRNDQPSKPQAPTGVGQPSINQNHLFIPPVTASVGHGNCPLSFDSVQNLAGGSSFRPTFPQASQAHGFNSPSNGVWTNAISCQQPQSMGFSNGFPTNVTAWQQQNHPRQPQMPLPNGMPFQQQFSPSQMFPNSFVLPGGQSNFVTGSSLMPWPAGLGQSGFNQPPFVMGLQGQHGFQPMNVGAQVVPNGTQTEHNYNLQPPSFVSGNNGTCQESTQGVYSSRGRKPYHRGGGRLGGGRGRHHSK